MMTWQEVCRKGRLVFLIPGVGSVYKLYPQPVKLMRTCLPACFKHLLCEFIPVHTKVKMADLTWTVFLSGATQFKEPASQRLTIVLL